MQLHAFRYIRIDRFLCQKLIDFPVPGFQLKDFRFRFFEVIFTLSLTRLFLLLLLPIQLPIGFSRNFLILPCFRLLCLRSQKLMLFQIIIIIADIID